MPQYTLGDLDARVLDRVDNNAGLYPTIERYNAINDAIRVVNLFTGFCSTTLSVPGMTVARQLVYSVPTGIIFPTAAYFEGRQLSPVSIRAIAMQYRTWTTDQSNRGMPVQHWIPMGIGMFAIHPADSAGGGDLSVTGISEPDTLSVATDSITLPDQWLTLIETLAAQVIQIKESSAIFSQASLLYQEFIRGVRQYVYWESMTFPRFFIKSMAQEQKEQLGDE